MLTCIYYFNLLLIISLHLITSFIPIFSSSSIKLIFSTSLLWLFIILMAIHHPDYSSLFVQFSIFLFFIKNCHKVFMTNFIIYRCLDILLSMLFNLLLASITVSLCFFVLFLVVFYKSCSIWKCKTTTFTHSSYRCSNNSCKWWNRNATSCYR